ncbi:MAG: hypothetical protein AAF974_11700 [Cyanobacteria bacterium P01_E01_bin.34]
MRFGTTVMVQLWLRMLNSDRQPLNIHPNCSCPTAGDGVSTEVTPNCDVAS